MLRQIDLCSGVGAGFPLAATVIHGFKLRGLCERDEFCCDLLRDRFPGIPIYPDVKELWLKPSYADLITASPPCQPFTLEGKRLGSKDPRDCIPAVLRIVRRSQPKFFCLENVPGLLSAPINPGNEPGSYFQQMLQELWSSGYDAEWVVVGTQQFTTPWRGERLLLVATSRCVVEKFRIEPTTWEYQIRGASEETGHSPEKRSLQSRVAGTTVRTPDRLDIPPGTKSGNRINRARRAALGNILDPRIAQLALKRVLYLNSISSHS
ncbi:DNA cytosine methyltransferase [Calothrix sp. UHCC 0171]|uniref:DNA cytosine methyltransferase n=1 Tax=Calothrix sp. UHCC 0171 TaxID=3110245 RepID=UPI002B2191AD|nr:DNA cytosine methyltransferase [Calothrix sp. UHCC 0171]MEA5574693.1 DNA cytosine methyltransferase [Calothrix sp. UHCC 0171]